MPGYKDPPKEHQFKEGNPGGGRPKGSVSFKAIIRRWADAMMDEINPETGEIERMSLADIITLKQFQKAKKGDTRAYEILKNHIEALPKQGIDLTSAGEKIGQKEIIFKRYSKKDGDKS